MDDASLARFLPAANGCGHAAGRAAPTSDMEGLERASNAPRARRAPGNPWRSSILRQTPSRGYQ